MSAELALFGDLALVLGASVGVVVLLRRLGVPSIAGFIVAGFLMGPEVLGGARAVYGDVSSPEVLKHLGLAHASCLVLAISDFRSNERTVRAAQELAPHVSVGVRAMYATDIPLLRAFGATEVFSAEITAAIEMLASVLSKQGVEHKEIERKIEELRERWERQDQPTRA